MSDKCPKCGAPIIDEQSSWVIYSCDSHLHRKHGYLERGEACSQKEIYQLQAQLAQLREQLAKADAEAKRYREAWASVRKQWDNEATIAAGWNVPSGDRLASLLRQCIDDMDALVPPTEQGTTHD